MGRGGGCPGRGMGRGVGCPGKGDEERGREGAQAGGWGEGEGTSMVLFAGIKVSCCSFLLLGSVYLCISLCTSLYLELCTFHHVI